MSELGLKFVVNSRGLCCTCMSELLNRSQYKHMMVMSLPRPVKDSGECGCGLSYGSKENEVKAGELVTVVRKIKSRVGE